MIRPAYIALGSNLNNPMQQVTRAIDELAALPESRFITQSHWYRSAPMGPADQPQYINGVALVETGLAALALLRHLQEIERLHRRQRGQRWGPRTLDLDLLLYDDQIIDEPDLRVPHPGLRIRNFVLYPLADIDPKLKLPTGESLGSLLAQCPAAGLTRLDHSTGAKRG